MRAKQTFEKTNPVELLLPLDSSQPIVDGHIVSLDGGSIQNCRIAPKQIAVLIQERFNGAVGVNLGNGCQCGRWNDAASALGTGQKTLSPHEECRATQYIVETGFHIGRIRLQSAERCLGVKR